jgi:hypothetical protein
MMTDKHSTRHCTVGMELPSTKTIVNLLNHSAVLSGLTVG